MGRGSQGTLYGIILDEIALEGLEGVTIPSLWVYLSAALESPLPLKEELKKHVWSIIQTADECLLFYVLPAERPVFKAYDRFDRSRQDPYLGVPLSLDECPYTSYKFEPIEDGDILGSCEYYRERIQIPADTIRTLNLEQVMQTWASKFVIVGTQQLRYDVLTPENVPIPKDLTLMQYCIWEAIGRSRFNGETTSGTWSLQRFCKDSTIVFYVKNRLLWNGLVAQQPFTEKRGSRLISSTLLTLPRFFSLHKSVFHIIIERLVQVLKEAPKYRLEFAKARAFFPTIDSHKTFKKIVMTHFFRRIFEVVNIPIQDGEDVVRSNEKTRKDRAMLFLQLKNPNVSVQKDIFCENEEEAEDIADFYSEKHTFVDMPVMEEFYRCIDRHGNRGCSQTDICNYLAMHSFTVRQVIKKALDEGLVTSYYLDCGRQRTNMYVAIQHSEQAKKHQGESLAVLKSLRCAEEPRIPEQPADDILKDVPFISARVKPYEYDCSDAPREDTLRNVLRKALVIKAIDAQCIIPVVQLRNIIQQVEKENGYKDAVCRKSVRRLLVHLSKHGFINLYEVTLQFEEHIRLHRYVTHPKIDPDHTVMQREILRMKNQFYLSLEERRLREGLQLQKQAAEQASEASDPSLVSVRKNLLPLSAYKSPKFLIARYFHELLVYIRYISNDKQKPIPVTEELLKRWQQAEPNLVISDYQEVFRQDNESALIVPYTEDISWRTFIPPLPNYDDKPLGWLILYDAVIDRMPLFIFNKIFRLDKSADERLSEYLAHPIRQHYLVKQLPRDMQSRISRVRLQNIYLNIVKILNNMGLVQVAERRQKDPLQMWIYLNRHGQVLDTTPSEAGYAKVNPDRSYNAYNFEFRSAHDVNEYWTTLHRICLHTKLGFRLRRHHRKRERNPNVVFTSPVQFDEAAQRDVAPHVPGDRQGAGGLSTHLFSHTFRNWSWVVQTNTKLKTSRKGRSIRRAPKILTQHYKTALKSSGCKVGVWPLKRSQGRSGAGHVKRASALDSTKRNRLLRDAIDRDALKNMRTLRVSWRKEEDEIIKMARAVYLYLSAPIVLFNLVNVGKICRDVIRHHLGSCNKTSQACLRRGQFIVKMNRHLPEVPSWLHFLQTDPRLQARYGEDFINKLKEAHPSRENIIKALCLHFVLLLYFLYKHVNDESFIERPRFIIPDTIREFEQEFKECVPLLEDRSVSYWNPDNEFDLQMFTVTNVLHSLLCCTRDKTTYNLQAFEIYKHYSEEVLHEAFEKARADGLVSAVKRKNMHATSSSPLAGPAYIFSQKYRFRLTYLKIPYGVYDYFFQYFCDALRSMFGPTTSKNSGEQYLQLQSPNASHLFFIAEGLTNNRLQVDIKLPPNILTVDPEQAQTDSSVDRILEHYQYIFDNAPETEYTKHLETDEEEKQVRIRFHRANLSYKVYYSPYDKISKLPTRCLHFFCALDHLQHDVDINFANLQRKYDDHDVLFMECPFSCIMKHADYINHIERIVKEKKSVLSQLQEMSSQQLINLANSANTVKVQPSNLLTLARMFESFCREKEAKMERKDLGKIAPLRPSKSIDWQKLCEDILEYNTNDDALDYDDEYEPTLNKEDQFSRAQDVFVINLPHLQLSPSEELLATTDRTTHEGVEVPKSLVTAALQRDEILQKVISESLWKYTDNTFETLKTILYEHEFTPWEVQRLQKIHDYIQLKKLGVSVVDLMREFPRREFLLRALHTLSDHYLIKRVGVSTFMYVHKQHIRNWVAHTFHIKRLEREVLGSTNLSLKRKLEDADDHDASLSKKCKLGEQQEVLEPPLGNGKRLSKPTQRYADDKEKTTDKSEIAKETVIMKPQPWMRLNGSLNRRVLDKWLGSILTECISRCGCMLPDIFSRFPHMFPADIMFLLELLCDLKCIRLREMQPVKVTLFSEYEDLKESEVTELYNPDDTYVVANSDAFTKLAVFIGNKKYKSEFI